MTFFKIIILAFISITGWSKSANAAMSQVDCRDNALSESCICGYDQDSDFLIMECQSPLEAGSSKLPDIPARTIMCSNSLMEWPVIPDTYKKRAIALVLSENRISSIGDLTNLQELKLLNVSFNSLKKIDSQISKLNELIMLDATGNQLETIDFGDFVPNVNKATLGKGEQIFSKLQFLFLLGNQIKTINSVDLLFIGMPFINALFLDNNKIRAIDVDLTQQSLNVISKAKQATAQNKTYLKALSVPSQYGFYLGFSYNVITRVKFNFKSTLNEIFEPYKKFFLTKYLSISLNSQNNRTICDCNLYKDMVFLIDSLNDAFKNEEIPDGDILNLQCYIEDSSTPVKLFDVINQNIVSQSQFCRETTIMVKPTTTTVKAKETTKKTASSTKVVATSKSVSNATKAMSSSTKVVATSKSVSNATKAMSSGSTTVLTSKSVSNATKANPGGSTTVFASKQRKA